MFKTFVCIVKIRRAGYNNFIMKKIIIILILIFSLLSFVAPSANAADEIKLYFFYGDGCPHCAKEEIFLNHLSVKYPRLKINRYEVWHDKSNLKLLQDIGQTIGIDVSSIPVTIIGNWSIDGYLNDQTTGLAIENQIIFYQTAEYTDVIEQIIEKYSQPSNNQNQNINQNDNDQGNQAKVPDKLQLPIFGEVDLKSVSLPALTVMIGILDGFNPCAMWVLIFLIGLLLKMENKRKRWILGFAFIIASAAVYFVFMAAWLNFLLFIGMIVFVRIAIGLVAFVSGVFNLRDYWKNRSGVCKVTKNQKRRKIIEKLIAITQNNKFYLALLGIVVLAFAVNLIELVCSAGLPAVYTQILALSNLSFASYYLYILLYIFFFMIDDLIIFVIAMLTLQATGLSTKYSRFSNLIGGIIMLIIGLLLIFKPGVLMFG